MDCLVIGTNLEQRMPSLLSTLTSIDTLQTEFKNKILSLDMFTKSKDKLHDISNCIKLVDYCRVHKWMVLMHERLGMCENILHGLKRITSEYFLYSEDDVIIDSIPSLSFIEKYKRSGDKVGFISLTMGGWDKSKIEAIATKINKKRQVFELDELDYIDSVTSDVRDKYIILEQEAEYKDGFYISFPVSVFNSNVFRKIIDSAKENQKMVQIEQAMTNEWFRLGYDKKYSKLVYLQNFYKVHNVSFFGIKPSKVLPIMESSLPIKHNRGQPQGVLWDYWFHEK